MKTLFCFLCILAGGLLQGQEKKTVEALRITAPIVIDGILDEDVYSIARPAKDFVQLQPYNGKPSMQPSEVYIFYDQAAVYVGAKLFDSAPDSIYNFLCQRDQIGASDYFGIYFDPYNQGQVAYGFFIIPSGVQTDIKAVKGERDYEDPNWNAIWQSKTRITKDGWLVEMRIPFSALRFPENGGGTWGLNMFRNIRRYNSNNSWNLIDRKVSGFIHQEGLLTGIDNIRPPVRLSLTPFSALYTQVEKGNANPSMRYKGGMDLKYGINESFTLDMMLIPDFGQIQSDYKKMNLTPFELYYSERRQFFTEGTELFNRGDIFYSRRIGASPKFSQRINDSIKSYESIDFIPSETQILNATKISGRTSEGWGLGSLNAVTLASYAVVINDETLEKRKILVQPFTNYNITTIDKTLKNNSYISLINSSMIMAGDPFYSNITATDFQVRNKAKTIAIKGKGGVSLRNQDNRETGYFSSLAFDKNSGKLQFGISQRIYSDKYNPNDLGYLRRNNEVTTSSYLWYAIREPFWIFRETSHYLSFTHSRMYRGLYFSGNELFLNSFSTFKNNYSFMFNAWLDGNTNDYYEPRVAGRFYSDPASFRYQTGVFSDHTKPLSFSIRFISLRTFNSDKSSDGINTDIGLRIRKKFQMRYSAGISKDDNSPGFSGFKGTIDTIVFAKRDIRSYENAIYLAYTLNNKSGINLQARHYTSTFRNNGFYSLGPKGSLEPVSHDSPDGTFNMLNIDLIFRWIFAPGSELSLAWKKNIFDSRQEAEPEYLTNFKNLFRADQTDSFSLKILYYLDYNTLRNKF
jgi:hypothetical protein